MNSIHVLLVNDSLIVSRVIRKVLSADPQFSPVGWAKDGLEAENYVSQQLPDIILMDIHMPNQDGVETTGKILAKHKIPILIVTATISMNMNHIFQCIQQGALEAVKPPLHPAFVNIDRLSQEELEKIGAAFIAKVKIIASLKNKVNSKSNLSAPFEEIVPTKRVPPKEESLPARYLVAVGASTGGPEALTHLLKSFPQNFPAAVVIVQHMDADFLPSLVDHLQRFSRLPIQEAVEGVLPLAGRVYLASKQGNHLICDQNNGLTYHNNQALIHTPSINLMFESVASSYLNHAVGVLLTGMGSDGAQGLKLIHDKGGFTLAQDKESCVVYGMPKVAVELNACSEVLPPIQIGERINKHLII